MKAPLEDFGQQSSYRRGTVMGLTAAEAFMLIAFILLTLLVLWRVTANEEKERLVEENVALSERIERLGSQDAILEAVAFQQRFENRDPDVMEERLTLLEDESLVALVQEIRSMTDDGRRELTDMVRSEAFPGAREKVEAIDRLGLVPGDIDALLEANAEAQKLRKELDRTRGELAAFVEIEATPEEFRKMRTALEQIDAQSETSARTGAEIAATIADNAGHRIAALGGQILPDGDVIFPDAVLFDANQAEIRPKFDTLLQSFCRIWFETLYEQREALDTVQVEGHASSEYGTLGPKQAFVANLDLSQRRAAAVFGRCLAYGGDDEITDWARSAMAAIGYSSSRPVLEEGEENRAASRRVVFAVEPKTETQMAVSVIDKRAALSQGERPEMGIDDRDDEVEALRSDGSRSVPNASYYEDLGFERLRGRVTEVRDGDTVVVGDQAIRLEGLHAPEIGTEMGRKARALMRDLALDEGAVCWLSGEQTYDRLVGICFVEGSDIGAAIISAGMGRDCPAFSNGRYAGIESPQASMAMELPEYCLVN